jgi:hypothetical protein
MLGEVHHVALHAPDLRAVAAFVTGCLQAVELDAPDARPTGAAARHRPEAAPRPIAASYALGTCVLEIAEPRDPMGWHQDVIRRGGGPTASHLAWRVEDIAGRHDELCRAGARVLERQPGTSPHGRYRVVNLVPGDETRGVWYQIAEDVPSPDAGPAAASPTGPITHLHHVVHHVWGLDYTVDLLRHLFSAEPVARLDLSATHGSRWALYEFGRSKAYFVEPSVFGHPLAALTSTTGTLSGLGGGGVSGLGWAVADLPGCVATLAEAGVHFTQERPQLAPCGDHWFIDTDPRQAGGVSFRLCEDAA